MGRGKVQMKRIANKVSRQVTFTKRRHGLLKKAHELAVLCDAHLGVVIFSGTDKLYEYCSPHTSWRELIQRYDSISNAHLQGTDDDQQMSAEIARLRHERDQLRASIRRQTGEDLSPLSTKELDILRKQLELALRKVCARKDELLNQRLDELHHKINEDRRHRATAEAPAVAAEGMALPARAFGASSRRWRRKDQRRCSCGRSSSPECKTSACRTTASGSDQEKKYVGGGRLVEWTGS